MDVRVTHTSYLVALLTEASVGAGRLLDLLDDERERLTTTARRDFARLSARLDGSPLEDATVVSVDAGDWQRPATVTAEGRAGGWAAALRLEGMATQEVAAVEYANLLSVYDEVPHLAARFFDEPTATLAQLHGLICQGLVDPEVVGRLRVTEQAVHDGAQGMVIFNAPDPARLPELLADLDGWLRGDGAEGSTAFSACVVAAIVHELILQWQPYEAGNGRVARAAARLVLRARGLDPHGVLVPERQWAADPGGYYNEVAATIRRRGDLTPWVERHTEALVAAVTAAVDTVRPPPDTAVPERAMTAAGELAEGQSITVREYATRWAISRESAWRDLWLLTRAGVMAAEANTLGRRFRKV